MPTIEIDKSERKRNKLTKEQKKKIKKLYKEVADDISKEVESLKGVNTTTASLKKLRLAQLKKDVEKRLKQLSSELEEIMIEGMNDVSMAVQEDINEWLLEVGFPFKLSNLPDDVVEDIVMGRVYKQKWYLSKRIWSINKKNLDDINKIITKGLAENKGVYDIAKDLERYVKPSARKDWKWSKVYPGTNKVIDYNAQRLARTLIQHAYQKSFERANANNPWVSGYMWHSALAHGRTCELCKSRDGVVYKKDELPMDHPNGLCTWSAVLGKSLDSIADDILKWKDSPSGTYPEIDKFAKQLEPKWNKFM